jgi:hypothetical protein
MSIRGPVSRVAEIYCPKVRILLLGTCERRRKAINSGSRAQGTGPDRRVDPLFDRSYFLVQAHLGGNLAASRSDSPLVRVLLHAPRTWPDLAVLALGRRELKSGDIFLSPVRRTEITVKRQRALARHGHFHPP